MEKKKKKKKKKKKILKWFCLFFEIFAPVEVLGAFTFGSGYILRGECWFVGCADLQLKIHDLDLTPQLPTSSGFSPWFPKLIFWIPLFFSHSARPGAFLGFLISTLVGVWLLVRMAWFGSLSCSNQMMARLWLEQFHGGFSVFTTPATKSRLPRRWSTFRQFEMRRPVSCSMILIWKAYIQDRVDVVWSCWISTPVTKHGGVIANFWICASGFGRNESFVFGSGPLVSCSYILNRFLFSRFGKFVPGQRLHEGVSPPASHVCLFGGPENCASNNFGTGGLQVFWPLGRVASFKLFWIRLTQELGGLFSNVCVLGQLGANFCPGGALRGVLGPGVCVCIWMGGLEIFISQMGVGCKVFSWKTVETRGSQSPNRTRWFFKFCVFKMDPNNFILGEKSRSSTRGFESGLRCSIFYIGLWENSGNRRVALFVGIDLGNLSKVQTFWDFAFVSANAHITEHHGWLRGGIYYVNYVFFLCFVFSLGSESSTTLHQRISGGFLHHHQFHPSPATFCRPVLNGYHLRRVLCPPTRDNPHSGSGFYFLWRVLCLPTGGDNLDQKASNSRFGLFLWIVREVLKDFIELSSGDFDHPFRRMGLTSIIKQRTSVQTKIVLGLTVFCFLQFFQSATLHRLDKDLPTHTTFCVTIVSLHLPGRDVDIMENHTSSFAEIFRDINREVHLMVRRGITTSKLNIREIGNLNYCDTLYLFGMVVHSWCRTILTRRYHSSGLFSCNTRRFWNGMDLVTKSFPFINDVQTPVAQGLSQDSTLSLISSTIWRCPGTVGFCGLAKEDTALSVLDSDDNVSEDVVVDALPHNDSLELKEHSDDVNTRTDKRKAKGTKKKSIVEFSKVDADLLPTVILVGRPNVGKSALFNRLIQRREALVYNTPNDHVTRDIREGIAKLGDLRFRVLDSAGLETAATSGSILDRTTGMTGHVLARSQFAVFLIDVRDGLQPLDFEVGSWLRKHASGIPTLLVMNKSESLDDHQGYLMAAAGEAYKLGYGDPIALSAETGLGMADLYDSLRPLLEEYMLHVLNEKASQSNDSSSEVEESKLPLQLAIVGRPNVGKSTMLNALLQQDRVLVGPEAGLTRDSVRAEFQYQGQRVYLVDTAGWLQRSKKEKGPGSLSVMQSRKSLMRAHVIALVLDADEIAKARCSMNHAEVVIARRAVEEGRGLVVIVNKMDLLRGKENAKLYEKVIKAVPEEIQTVIPQITGIPVVFVSALEGKGRIAIMRQVMQTYEKWCLRLSTARLNRWLCKVMSRHSWKDQAAQPKIKYFTQVKARPPTFVAFLRGKIQLSDTDIRFLTRSLKEDFDLGGIPIRIMQRAIPRKASGSTGNKSVGKMPDMFISDKRTVSPDKVSSDKRTVSADPPTPSQ